MALIPNRSGATSAYHGTGRSRGNVFGAWSNYSIDLTNSYSMFSVSHPGWKKHLGDTGGPWYLEKIEYQASPFVVNTNTCQGPVLVTSRSGGTAPYVPSFPSETTMNSKGTTAIARVEPGSPGFEMSTAVGELMKDGVPDVILSGYAKNRTRDLLKTTGDEYLNVQFGWLPLVADIRKFCQTVIKSEEIYNQYKKGSSKNIKRAYSFPSDSSTKAESGGNYFNQPQNIFMSGTTSDSLVSETWFEGCFKYFIPTSSGQAGKISDFARKARVVYGANLTPELLWNLSPWSWAADWFGTTGDVLHNISNLGRDGLVMKYGYIMSSSISRRNMTASSGSFVSRYNREHSIKLRFPATPYGFGVNLQALSSKQISIITALGLSKGGKPWNFQS